jgi:uncharacterized protein YceK
METIMAMLMMARSCGHVISRMIPSEASPVQAQGLSAWHCVEHHIGARVRTHAFVSFFVAVIHP